MSRYLAAKHELKSLTRALDSYIALEMIGLWLIEWLLMAIVLYFVLTKATSAAGTISRIDLSTIEQATVCALTISFISVAIGLYRSEICARRNKFMLAAAIAGILLAPVVGTLIHPLGLDLGRQSAVCVAEIFGGWVACLLVTRVGFHLAQRTDMLARRVVVIGAWQSGVRIQAVINASAGSVCHVVAVMAPGARGLDAAALRRRRIWGVVIAGDLPNTDALRASIDPTVLVFDEAAFCENRLQRLDTDSLPADWRGVVASSGTGRWRAASVRAFDLAASLGFLLATLPLMLLVALAIKIECPGPVFYRQDRVGLHGRVFGLRKFRSMTVNAEAAGAPVWAAQNDPRVTKVGRFIRRTRIDELPQFLNVLAGEMSFIGPRPERPHFVAQLATAIPNYTDRACLKPGITGWAQIKFPYGASIEDARMKLAYDLYYVKHRSLFLNLLIMVATVRVILFQEGSR